MYDQSRLDRLILSILLFLIFLFLITIIISCEGSQKDNLFLNNNNQSKLLDQILQMNKDDNSNNKNDNKNKFNQIFLSPRSGKIPLRNASKTMLSCWFL